MEYTDCFCDIVPKRLVQTYGERLEIKFLCNTSVQYFCSFAVKIKRFISIRFNLLCLCFRSRYTQDVNRCSKRFISEQSVVSRLV